MTPIEAARWMLEEVEANGELYQDSAASMLLSHGDDSLAYYDDEGYACLGKKVLAEFKRISPDIVWSRSGKYWRPRDGDDEPGRMQA